MIRFEVLEPKNVQEACSLLAQSEGEARVIAGGQNLLPLLRQRRIRPRALITIKRLSELDYIREENGEVRIGALATHRSVEFSDVIKEKFGALVEVEKGLGCIQTRNWGTLGGNLCQASPATDLPPILIALEARIRATGMKGERVIPLGDFFVDYQKTALQRDELLCEIVLPKRPPRSGVAYAKETVRFNDPPIASVAAMVRMDGKKTVEDIRIILQAVGVVPLRAREAEREMLGKTVTGQLLQKVAEAAAREAKPVSDVYGSAGYKREMIKNLTKRVINISVTRAV